MSKLDELIQKYYPNGVEHKKLADIGQVKMCKRILKSQTNDNGEIPFFKIGTFGGIADAYISQALFDEYSKKYPFPNKGDILISAAGTIGRMVIYDGNPAYYQDSNIVWLAHDESLVLNTYLKYCYEMKPWSVSTGGTIARLYNDNILNAVIPVPPLPVQNEIVRILDNFTELQAKLQAELTARKKQYEYYKEMIFCSYDYENIPLGDVLISIHTGLNPRKFFSLNTEDAENYYVTIREFKGGQLQFTDKTDRINDEALRLCNNRSNLEIGDVLFSGTGTVGETYVIEEEPSNWNIKEGVYALKPNSKKVLSKYLKYYLSTKKMKDKYDTLAEGGTVKSISMKKMETMAIQLPSIANQKNIIAILDRFDALCNDITSGLPAEIEARQKQYEYYRDKLLTFHEAG